MNPVIWLLVGALLGWLASAELAPVVARDRVVNVLAGAGGALFAGWLMSRSLGPGAFAVGELSVAALIEAAFGAVLLLVLVNLVRLIRTP